MKNKKIKNLSVSNKMSISFSIIALIVAILFYFLLPSLLNYPPDTINTQFDKEVSKLYYIYQYMIAVVAILLLFIVYFKISLRKIDKWVKNKDKTKEEMDNDVQLKNEAIKNYLKLEKSVFLIHLNCL